MTHNKEKPGGRSGRARRVRIENGKRGRDLIALACQSRGHVFDCVRKLPTAGLRLDPPVDTCPIEPLGKRGLQLYFRDRTGEVVRVAGSSMGRLTIIALFGGDLDWLETNFPPRRRRDRRFNVEAVFDWLLQAATAAGPYDEIAMAAENNRLLERLRA